MRRFRWRSLDRELSFRGHAANPRFVEQHLIRSTRKVVLFSLLEKLEMGDKTGKKIRAEPDLIVSIIPRKLEFQDL